MSDDERSYRAREDDTRMLSVQPRSSQWRSSQPLSVRWRRTSPQRVALGLPRRTGLAWPGAAAVLILLAGCGGSSGSPGTAGGTPAGGTTTSAPATTPTSTAPAAAGGSMGCLAGTWRSDDITDPHLSLKGGAGAVLTISGDGGFTMNTSSMKPVKGTEQGISATMRYTGQESGHFRVSGAKLVGTSYSAGDMTVDSTVDGQTFTMPMSDFSKDAHGMGWESFSCSGNTLTMINPPPASSWSFTRIG